MSEMDHVNQAVESYLNHFQDNNRQKYFLQELTKGMTIQERTRFFELTTIGLMRLINEFNDVYSQGSNGNQKAR